MTIEKCPLLEELGWVKHGFFNRKTPIASDMTGIQYFSGDFPRAFFLPQTHSDVAIPLLAEFPETGADASYSDAGGDRQVALAVKTADCCPILIACTRSKSIAAIHAGWPGALNQIVMKTLHQMVLDGCDPTRMIAAIGPCLHKESFNVRKDLYDRFMAEQPEYIDYFEPFEDHWKLDNIGIISHQLKYMGVFNIWVSGHNTFTNPDYFSFRDRIRDPSNETGRNASLIAKISTER